MTSTDSKLDEILKQLQRLNNIERKIDSFNNRLTSLEAKFSNKCEELDCSLNAKASIESIEKLNERLAALESFENNYAKSLLLQESYNKRLNILVHGIKEEDNNVWETREETIAKFRNFVREGLKIEDPEDIEYVDIHRLPQHPVSRLGKKVHRPIIIKLLTMQDKKMLYKSVKNLKPYNARLKLEQTSHPYVYVSDHLPQAFQNQRKLLLPHYKEAKKRKQNTLWKAIDGEYCLYVEGKKIEL